MKMKAKYERKENDMWRSERHRKSAAKINQCSIGVMAAMASASRKNNGEERQSSKIDKGGENEGGKSWRKSKINGVMKK
jgi:hypothetical protein